MSTVSCSRISHIQDLTERPHHFDQPTRQHTSSIHHYPPQCCTFRQTIEAKRSHHPSSLATPLASHPSANFIQNLCPYFQHPFRVISALHVILGHARAKVESRSSLCSSAKGDYVTQRTFSSFGRRAFAVAGPFEWNNLPVSLRHESSINHSKPNLNSSSSNLLRIIYSGHYALNNIKRFRIRLVFKLQAL